MSLELQGLIEKLNDDSRRALESAAELCVSQTHYNVELEHLLMRLIEAKGGDVQRLMRYYDINGADLARELTLVIDRFKRGNSRTPALSPYILQLLEQAWLVSSLQYGEELIRPGAVVQALMDHDPLRGVILDSAPSLKRIAREAPRSEFIQIIKAGDAQAEEGPPAGGPGGGAAAPAVGRGARRTASATPSLDQYTIDLTARARAGEIDPIYGRDGEIRQLIDILTRRRQNNPILCGEAGVGKTAVVEGFARRIIGGDVPPPLRAISLRMLDLALLQAGAGIKGEFEKRLKAVIEEVKRSPQPIILFIDEAHTMIGAGAQAGQGDAANLLKPALARGELRTIAATTWGEYKKYFEKDAALARRFQVVQVDEPEEEAAVEMLRGVVANLETHHRVSVLDEAVWDAVRLSHRYITGRQLPDKAISVLDTACARVAVGQNGTPAEIEDVTRRRELVELELGILRREQATGVDHAARLDILEGELEALGETDAALSGRLQSERTAVGRVLDLQRSLQKPTPEAGEPDIEADKSVPEAGESAPDGLRAQLVTAKRELARIQGDTPMVPLCVDSTIIAQVVSNWTGIPVGKMLADEIDTVLRLKEKLAQRIIGQDPALDVIARRIRTFRAGLDDPGKPVGVFLLVGPSGVGKTETALALAELLYGGDRNMVAINMSEYQEAYTVSGLKGAPPGYVGYGKGGVLTEAVRHKPYSAVLLDEVEKAHPDVMELFYQVFDKGVMEDSDGLTVDFKNTVILMTANTGSETILRTCRDGARQPDPEALLELLRPELVKVFKPALLGRLVVVPYYPLSDAAIRQIVRLKLEKIRRRFDDHHHVAFTWGDDLVAAIAARCTEVDTGARNVDHLLTHSLLPELSAEILRRMAAGQVCTAIHARLDAQGGFDYHFEGPAAQTAPADDGQAMAGPGRGAQERTASVRDLLDGADRRLNPRKSKRWRELLKRF